MTKGSKGGAQEPDDEQLRAALERGDPIPPWLTDKVRIVVVAETLASEGDDVPLFPPQDP